MLKPGYFSSNYHSRRNKQNHQYNANNNSHQDDIDFPLAVSQSKQSSIHRLTKKCHKCDSIAIKKSANNYHKMIQEIQHLKSDVQKLKGKLQQSHKNMNEKIYQYESYIKKIQTQSQKDQSHATKLQKEKQRYQNTIRKFVLWLIETFHYIKNSSTIQKRAMDILVERIVKIFNNLNQYIQELAIQGEIQKLHLPQQQYNGVSENSIWTEHSVEISSSLKNQKQEFEEKSELLNMQVLLDTFNQRVREQQQDNDSIENIHTITKKLFSESPLISCAIEDVIKDEQNQIIKKKIFKEGETLTTNQQYLSAIDNHLRIEKGQAIKLLRRVGKGLCIVEYGDCIGYIPQYILF